MVSPKALVLSGDGVNADSETSWALTVAGFDATCKHVTDLLDCPEQLADIQLLAIPGGFSFGDEIASGKILALKIKQKVGDLLHQFVDRGKLVLGICNGFQVLVQMGFLPFSEPCAPKVVTLTRNSGGKFINRWVDLTVNSNVPSPFFDSLDNITLPIRHGEGRLCLSPEDNAETVEKVKAHAPLRYKEDVNGSFDRIAALSNSTGNVLGLMPHPEAFIRATQDPNWHRVRPIVRSDKSPKKEEQVVINPNPHGLLILSNAARSLGATV